MVKALCVTYSPPLLSLAPPNSPDAAEEPYHPFPAPSALAAPDVTARLRSLGFGYRADFIQKTAAMLVDAHGKTPSPGRHLEPSEEWLRTLRKMNTTDARAELLKLMGVGRKVADCILLMSLDKVSMIVIRYYDCSTSGIAGSHSCGHACTSDCNQALWTAWHFEDRINES